MGKHGQKSNDPQDDVIWIQMNRDFLWENFPGQWIAVYGQELIAVGDDPDRVLDEAIAKGYEEPLVTGVRRREYQKAKMIRRA